MVPWVRHRTLIQEIWVKFSVLLQTLCVTFGKALNLTAAVPQLYNGDDNSPFLLPHFYFYIVSFSEQKLPLTMHMYSV